MEHVSIFQMILKKMHLNMLFALYIVCINLLTLLTSVSVEANSVDKDQTAPRRAV